MLRYAGWHEAADKILKLIRCTIEARPLTFDLALFHKAAERDLARRRTVEEKLQSIMSGAALVGTTGFDDAVVAHMDEAD